MKHAKKKIAAFLVRNQGVEDPCTSQETTTQKRHWNGPKSKSGLDKRWWWFSGDGKFIYIRLAYVFMSLPWIFVTKTSYFWIHEISLDNIVSHNSRSKNLQNSGTLGFVNSSLQGKAKLHYKCTCWNHFRVFGWLSTSEFSELYQ